MEKELCESGTVLESQHANTQYIFTVGEYGPEYLDILDKNFTCMWFLFFFFLSSSSFLFFPFPLEKVYIFLAIDLYYWNLKLKSYM